MCLQLSDSSLDAVGRFFCNMAAEADAFADGMCANQLQGCELRENMDQVVVVCLALPAEAIAFDRVRRLRRPALEFRAPSDVSDHSDVR